MITQQNAFLICRIICITMVFFSPKTGVADVSLDTAAFDIPDRQPSGIGWCWAASSQFVLDYYGTHVEQCDIVNWTRIQKGWGNDDCCINPSGSICNQGNWLWPPDGYGTGCVIDILSNWGVNGTARSPMEQSSIVYESNRGRPVSMDWWLIPEDDGHVEVITGYRQDGAIIEVWNPWPGQYGVYEGGYKDWTYSALVSDSSHYWRYALSMTSDVPKIYISYYPSFGGVSVGTSSTAHIFTISNTGLANLVIGNVSINGTESALFVKSNDSCSSQTVQPGNSCTMQLIFNPSSAGHKFANLVVTSNAANGRTLGVCRT